MLSVKVNHTLFSHVIINIMEADFIIITPDTNIINLFTPDSDTVCENLRKKLEQKPTCSFEMDGKKWKPVPGFENNYKISENGDIYSTHKGGLLKPWFNKKLKQLCTKLCKKQIYIDRTVCRLVANAFLPNYEKGCVIKHIDGDKSNNNYKNLYIREKKLTNKKRLDKIKKEQKLNIVLRLRPNYSGVRRLMKDGSYKMYHYNYWGVDFREVGLKVFHRVFTTKEEARNFYLKKEKEYNAKYPSFRKKIKKAKSKSRK